MNKPHIKMTRSFIDGKVLWGLYPTKDAKKPIILARRLSTLCSAWRERIASYEAKKAERLRRFAKRKLRVAAEIELGNTQ